ncbi:uncharacterized protein WM294_010295 [Sarcoramphus papa]
MHGRRHGSMILPIAPWEQERTLLCQQQHHSTLQPLSERWLPAVVESAALWGSSLTARLPTELGHAPSRALCRAPCRQVPGRDGDAATRLRVGSTWCPGIPQDGTCSQAEPRGQRVGDLPPGWGLPRWAPASRHPPPQPLTRLSLFDGYEGNFYEINQV